MKKIVFLLFCMGIINCYGMRKDKRSQTFYESARNLREQAEQDDAELDRFLNVITFGLWPANSSAQSSSRHYSYDAPSSSNPQRSYNVSLRSDDDQSGFDISLSSKGLSYQRHRPFITPELCRSVLGIFTGAIALCYGIEKFCQKEFSKMDVIDGILTTSLGLAGCCASGAHLSYTIFNQLKLLDSQKH